MNSGATASPADSPAHSAATARTRRRRPWWARTLIGIGIFLLVVVVGAAGYVGYLAYRVPSNHLDPITPGSLTVADSATAASALQIEPFAVAITGGANATMTITDTSTGQVVWLSKPGTAFVSAGSGSIEWTEKFGYFWADVTRNARFTDQTVDTLTGTSTGGAVTGTVRDGDQAADYTLTLTPVRKDNITALGMNLEVRPAPGGAPISSVLLTSGRADGEGVYGFGEQFRDFDLAGEMFPILVSEQGIGRGEQPITTLADLTNWAGGNLATTYGAWPTWVTSANRSFTLTNTDASGAFGIADLRRDGEISLESWASTMSAEVLAAASPAELIAARAAGASRPPLAPMTQEGAVLGLQGGTARVQQIVSEMQAAGADISGVWLQDWVGKRQTSFGSQLWWTWQLDASQYPGWQQMVADFAAADIDVLTYVNPFLADAADKGDPTIRNLYQEAADQGFLVKDSQGQPYVVQTVGFPVGLMDLTNPAARDWYAGVIASEVLGVGAKGFMADFGEALPFDAVLFAGTPAEQHNRFPDLWAQTVRQACEIAGQPECVAFMRSSYLNTTENVPMMWAGDQMVDFAAQDGLGSAVLGMLSGGVSGGTAWHSDIGGYTSINAVVKNYVRPPELNARWAEMQAFGAMMRTHEGNRPQVNQQVYDTPETRAQFARATQIFGALKDYRASVLDEAQRAGWPIMRHGWLVYPGTSAAQADLQFFLGAHLLVAPVTAESATTVDVTLPPGEWVHAFTGQTFAGDQKVTVEAPIGTPAAFVRADDPVGVEIRAALTEAGLTSG